MRDSNRGPPGCWASANALDHDAPCKFFCKQAVLFNKQVLHTNFSFKFTTNKRKENTFGRIATCIICNVNWAFSLYKKLTIFIMVCWCICMQHILQVTAQLYFSLAEVSAASSWLTTTSWLMGCWHVYSEQEFLSSSPDAAFFMMSNRLPPNKPSFFGDSQSITLEKKHLFYS